MCVPASRCWLLEPLWPWMGINRDVLTTSSFRTSFRNTSWDSAGWEHERYLQTQAFCWQMHLHLYEPRVFHREKGVISFLILKKQHKSWPFGWDRGCERPTESSGGRSSYVTHSSLHSQTTDKTRWNASLKLFKTVCVWCLGSPKLYNASHLMRTTVENMFSDF